MGKQEWTICDWFCFATQIGRKDGEFCRPITDRSEAKPLHPWITFDITVLKITEWFAFSLDDLLKAGCLHADSIVVVGYRSQGQMYDEEHMADASTIVEVQSIYRYETVVRYRDQYQYLGNCPPTAPLIQH